MSFFVVSWLSGYLFFVAPMGLGIREIVASFGLSFFVPFPIASTISILTRVCMIVGEMIFLSISYGFYKIPESHRVLRINPYLVIVSLFAILYFLYFAFFSILRHDAFLSGRFDLGNMSQTVWNTSQGRFFTLTNPDGVENVSRLAVHSDFILVFFTPLYFLWSDPRVLLIVQSLILAIGGIFIFLLAKYILKNNRISLILAISFYFNFWVHEQNIFDFHAVTLATTFLLATFYFLLKKRYFFFSLFLFLSVITKENVFLVASLFGIYLFLKEEKKIIGTLLFGFSLFAFYYLSSIAIPLARGEAHFALSNYSYLGSTFLEILINLFTKPQLIFSQIFNFSSLKYIHEILLSTGYLAILSPFYLFFALPDMAIYLLSQNYEYRSHQYHFGALIVPFVYIASIHGISKIVKKFGKSNIKIIFYYILVATAITTYYYSPLPGMKNFDAIPFSKKMSQSVKNYLYLIPSESSVSASNSIGAHLSHREKIYVVPRGMNIAEYIIFYNEKPEIVSQIDTNNYRLIISENNFLLYKRVKTNS